MALGVCVGRFCWFSWRKTIFWGDHKGFRSDLSCPWDYHNLMLIEVVTSTNADAKQRLGQLRQVSCDLREAMYNCECDLDCLIQSGVPSSLGKCLSVVLQYLLLFSRPTLGTFFCWLIPTRSCPSTPLWYAKASIKLLCMSNSSAALNSNEQLWVFDMFTAVDLTFQRHASYMENYDRNEVFVMKKAGGHE